MKNKESIKAKESEKTCTRFPIYLYYGEGFASSTFVKCSFVVVCVR